LDNQEEVFRLLGKFDQHLALIEDGFGVQVIPKGEELTFVGDDRPVKAAVFLLEQLLVIVRQGYTLTASEIAYAINLVKENKGDKLVELFADLLFVTSKGKKVRPLTLGQKQFVQAIRSFDVVFGIGPAGTGKTYLAMTMAVAALKAGEVERLILTRPAVEAGENLGFLPGDLQEKVDPYLRPLYDALYDLLGFDVYQKHLERGTIEIAPLAYMRGRTLDDSFIVLDEAQNSTSQQMKMFLTRLGAGSKAVITGDITQVDLPPGRFSGLVEVQEILSGISGIAFCYLNEKDVVRHSLVQKIIQAYEQSEQK